jgi:hypothetical protein
MSPGRGGPNDPYEDAALDLLPQATLAQARGGWVCETPSL